MNRQMLVYFKKKKKVKKYFSNNIVAVEPDQKRASYFVKEISHCGKV